MDPTYKGLGMPTPTKIRSNRLNLRPALFIGGGFLLLFVVASLVVSFLTPNTTLTSQKLLYRVDALSAFVNSARPNIKSEDLHKINADLALILTGDDAAVQKAIPAEKTTDELTKIKKAEADADTTAKLKTAKVNGEFDSTYKEALLKKLDDTRSLTKELFDKTSKASLKTTLSTLDSHLQVYAEQLKNLP